MHRIDADANVSNLFSEGDPGVPRQPTQIDAPWLNAVQEEICRFLENAGVTLVKGTWTQLRDSVANLTTAQTFTAKKTFAGKIGSGDVGFDAIVATGGEGDTNFNGGRAIVAVGGTGGVNQDGGTAIIATGGAPGGGGNAGIALEVVGGDNGGGVYAKALKATHGDVQIADGALTVSKTITTSTAGSSIAVEAVIAPTLGNSWANVGGSAETAGFYKDAMGRVHLQGLVTGGNSSVAFTLPSGYRPAKTKYFTCDNGTTWGRVTVAASGDVTITLDGTGGATVSLDGISFRV